MKNVPLSEAHENSFRKWRPEDGRSFKALWTIINDMLKKKYMKDDIVFLGSEKDVEMKLHNEKPPTSLLFEDSFKPLMRVARIDWK